MHQTRSELNKKLPLTRKGTKYVARALRNNSNSVPLVIALRDMLKLAETSKEVKSMIHNKAIKVNGKVAKDINDPVGLFNILGADKNYILTILPTGRFAFEETKETDRKLKVTGKRKVKKGDVQYSLHDGTNIISEKKFSVGDTLILSPENKVKKHLSFEKGSDAFIFSGSNVGKTAKVQNVSGSKITVKLDKGEVVLDNAQLIAI